jgi:hypothetical protein
LSRGVAHEEPEVNVDDGAVPPDHDVAVVAVFDLEEVGDQTVADQGVREVL